LDARHLFYRPQLALRAPSSSLEHAPYSSRLPHRTQARAVIAAAKAKLGGRPGGGITMTLTDANAVMVAWRERVENAKLPAAERK